MAAAGAGPSAGVHPERAVAADAVELEAVFFKDVLNIAGALEFLAGVAVLEHVVARLRPGCAGFLGKGEEALEPLAAVLCSLDAGVVNRFSHVYSVLKIVVP